MASGVKVTDDVKQAYNDVSMNKKNATKYKYAVFKFSDDVTKIVLDSKVEQPADDEDDNDLDDLLSKVLPPDDVRYIVYDYKYNSKDTNQGTSDLMFISWNPQGCSIKKKMLLASSLNDLRKVLNLGKNVIEAGDMSDCNSCAVLDKLGGLPRQRPCKQ